MSCRVVINGQAAPGSLGRSLFELGRGLGVMIPTSCGAQGNCRQCIVEVTSGMECLSARSAAEAPLPGRFRLACQSRITCDEGEVHCHTLQRGNMRIERRAFQVPVRRQNMPLDPAVTRDGRRILIDGAVIAECDGPLHGIAMDLGTTTVVLRLLNLETGEIVADAAFENPQGFAGSDVMSRIHFDTVNGGNLLAGTITDSVVRIIHEFPVDPATIYEMVVVGNSTMRDLFFRQDVHSIGQSPYQSITQIEMARGQRTTTSLSGTGGGCRLPIHPRGRVYGAPVISGHVGADAAACMLAIDLAREEKLVALMDIGTNTEIILGNRHRILAASCPAGPAFEGGAISCGMAALDGAIEEIRLREDGTWNCRIIGDTAPQGICGSGLVDLLGELIRTGRLNAMGRFVPDSHSITLDAAHGIHFLESDVNVLAQAKGANVAGIQVLFDTFGISCEDLDRLYLAGAFGHHLDAASARRIGLIPDIPDGRIASVGNAALEGACIMLLAKSRREELESLVRRVEHCRLETHPRFFDFFVEGCQFKPIAAAERVHG